MSSTVYEIKTCFVLYLPVWMIRCRRRARPVRDSGYLDPGLRNMHVQSKDLATERLHLVEDLVDRVYGKKFLHTLTPILAHLAVQLLMAKRQYAFFYQPTLASSLAQAVGGITPTPSLAPNMLTLVTCNLLKRERTIQYLTRYIMRHVVMKHLDFQVRDCFQGTEEVVDDVPDVSLISGELRPVFTQQGNIICW